MPFLVPFQFFFGAFFQHHYKSPTTHVQLLKMSSSRGVDKAVGRAVLRAMLRWTKTPPVAGGTFTLPSPEPTGTANDLLYTIAVKKLGASPDAARCRPRNADGARAAILAGFRHGDEVSAAAAAAAAPGRRRLGREATVVRDHRHAAIALSCSRRRHEGCQVEAASRRLLVFFRARLAPGGGPCSVPCFSDSPLLRAPPPRRFGQAFSSLSHDPAWAAASAVDVAPPPPPHGEKAAAHAAGGPYETPLDLAFACLRCPQRARGSI